MSASVRYWHKADIAAVVWVSDAVQAKDARLEPDRHLAKRRAFPKGDDESLTVLDAIRGKRIGQTR
jgi:hypothetical protein